MRRYQTRLVLDAFCGLITELLHAAYTKSLIDNYMPLAVLLSFLLPFIGFLGAVWFIEEKNWYRRLGYVLSGAVGYSVGTFLIMTLWH